MAVKKVGALWGGLKSVVRGPWSVVGNRLIEIIKISIMVKKQLVIQYSIINKE